MNHYSSVNEHIVQFLAENGVEFRHFDHEPTPTSADAARVRGQPLGCGLKALLLKADDQFLLFVLPGDRRLDSALAKRRLGVDRLRFASKEELFAQSGLSPGAVPPFGPPILPFKLIADVSVGCSYPHVAFNAGSLTKSVIMSAADWERLAGPARIPIAELLKPESPPAPDSPA